VAELVTETEKDASLLIVYLYSPTNERVCLPDCMTQAIKREWPNPPGENYTRFIRRRRRWVPPVFPPIWSPRTRSPAVVARSIGHPREIKIEKPVQEVIVIEDEE
jgi:hypothetical protein